MFMRPALKSNSFKYYEYVLYYVDDVVCISYNPSATMFRLQDKFKLKDDKIEEPYTYLGDQFTQFNNETNKEYWEISSDKYCASVVANVSTLLEKKGRKLPSKCVKPLSDDYRPEKNTPPELKSDRLQCYQELVGVLR